MKLHLSPELTARKLSVLSHPIRLSIVCLLNEGEKNVSELCTSLDKGQPQISQHLRLLSNHGLLFERREGQKVFYSVSPEVSNWIIDGMNLFSTYYKESP